MSFRIYLSPPKMYGKEIEHILDAFQTNWIAPYGPAIDRFETEMAQNAGVSRGLAVTSGTAGIHLALRCLGVGQGDFVFCSDFTFIGSCAPILYQNATPIFIDSEPEGWNMSPKALAEALKWAESEGKMPKAVIIVDLYGESADWERLLPICKQYGIPVIEDAAEAVGSSYKGKRCGSFGEMGVLSFNGNKIITTSGGGMVLSDNPASIDKMRFWATQAREPFEHYEHVDYGYNYRMSNICAAIGCGQMQYLEKKIMARKKIYDCYKNKLKDIPGYIKCHKFKGANYWLTLLYIEGGEIAPDDVITKLKLAEIEARRAWKPMHMQPLFKDTMFFSHAEKPTSEDVFYHAVCLPSGDEMTAEDITMVTEIIRECFL